MNRTRVFDGSSGVLVEGKGKHTEQSRRLTTFSELIALLMGTKGSYADKATAFQKMTFGSKGGKRKFIAGVILTNDFPEQVIRWGYFQIGHPRSEVRTGLSLVTLLALPSDSKSGA